MATSTATLTTANASRYLQQLCKHFGHKVPVDFTPDAGRVDLPMGTCRLAASKTELTLEVEGPTPSIQQLERFVGDHLTRFAFRENLTVAWTVTS